MARATAAAITKSVDRSSECVHNDSSIAQPSAEDLGISLIYHKLSKSTTSKLRTRLKLFAKAIIYLLIAVQHVANASMNQIFYVQQLL